MRSLKKYITGCLTVSDLMYQDPSIYCPFWSTNLEETKIKCMRLLVFETKEKRNAYLKSYCRSKDFRKCKIAAAFYDAYKTKKGKKQEEEHAGSKFIDRICGLK